MFRARNIYNQHQGLLAFFFKLLDVGFPGACRYVPVDAPYVIAELIGPDFSEFNPLPLEGCMILPAKDILYETLCADLDLSYFFE